MGVITALVYYYTPADINTFMLFMGGLTKTVTDSQEEVVQTAVACNQTLSEIATQTEITAVNTTAIKGLVFEIREMLHTASNTIATWRTQTQPEFNRQVSSIHIGSNKTLIGLVKLSLLSFNIITLENYKQALQNPNHLPEEVTEQVPRLMQLGLRSESISEEDVAAAKDILILLSLLDPRLPNELCKHSRTNETSLMLVLGSLCETLISRFSRGL